MAGKVLVPIQEHINRLVAIRLQFDIMGIECLIIARTDSEAATLITSNIDTRDHAFIINSANANERPLVKVMDEAAQRARRYRSSRTNGSPKRGPSFTARRSQTSA